jgi:hypothetical protein
MDKAKVVIEDLMLNIGVLGAMIGLNFVAEIVNEQLVYTLPPRVRGSIIGGTLSFAQQSAYKMFAHTPGNVIRN